MCSPLGGATVVHTTPYKYDAKLCPMILSCSACASPSVLRGRPDTTRTWTCTSVWRRTFTTARQRPCQKHALDHGLYGKRPGRQASARKQHSEQAERVTNARVSTCVSASQPEQCITCSCSAAGSTCRTGRGGRGRSTHLAALKKNEEVVVVARLKERPCLLAWDASKHGRSEHSLTHSTDRLDYGASSAP